MKDDYIEALQIAKDGFSAGPINDPGHTQDCELFLASRTYVLNSENAQKRYEELQCRFASFVPLTHIQLWVFALTLIEEANYPLEACLPPIGA